MFVWMLLHACSPPSEVLRAEAHVADGEPEAAIAALHVACTHPAPGCVPHARALRVEALALEQLGRLGEAAALAERSWQARASVGADVHSRSLAAQGRCAEALTVAADAPSAAGAWVDLSCGGGGDHIVAPVDGLTVWIAARRSGRMPHLAHPSSADAWDDAAARRMLGLDGSADVAETLAQAWLLAAETLVDSDAEGSLRYGYRALAAGEAAQVVIGRAWLRTGDPDRAIAALQAAGAEGREALVDALVAAGRPSEAADVLAEVLRDAPDADGLLRLAGLLEEADRRPEAARALLGAANRGSAVARIRVARHQRHANQPARARHQLERLLEEHPDHAEAMALLEQLGP